MENRRYISHMLRDKEVEEDEKLNCIQSKPLVILVFVNWIPLQDQDHKKGFHECAI